MRSKRLLALILTLAMAIGLVNVPQTAMAFDNGHAGEISELRANISFEYLGQTESTGNYKSLIESMGSIDQTNPPSGSVEEITSGKIIWVGVRLSDMTRVKDVLKSATINSTTGGIGDMTFSMTYNTEYLSPVTVANRVLISNGLINNYYPKPYSNADGEEINLYTGTIKTETPSSYALHGAEALHLSPGNYMDVIEQIQTADSYSGDDNEANYGTVPRLYQDTATAQVTDDAKIVAVFAFNVLKTPDEKGAKILQAALSGNRFNILGGYKKNDPKLTWLRNQTLADNLKNYFNVVDENGDASDGVVNLFPTKYEVRYYNNQTAAETAYNALKTEGATDITHVASAPAEGSELTDKDTVVTLPDLSKFTNADKTKVISGFKFFDGRDWSGSGEGETVEPPDTTFTKDTMMKDCYCDSNNIIYVYPEWVDGTKINFNTNFGNNTVDGKTAADDAFFDEYIYIPEGATTATVSDVNAKADTNFTIAGYALKDWYYDAGKTQKADLTSLDATKVNAGEIKLYAEWSKNWFITFDKNGGTMVDTEAADPTVIEVDVGQTIDAAGKTNEIPESPTDITPPDGYTFAGWNTVANGSGTAIAAADVATHAFTDTDADENSKIYLYAQWVPAANQDQVVIAFDKNNVDTSGATEPNPTPVTIKLGDALGTKMPNDPARTNYTFEGWNTQADGKGTTVDSTTRINNTTDITLGGTENPYDLTLYAQWKLDETKVTDDADKVTVTFYKNENGKLGTDTTDVYATYKIKKGDALGFVPGPITNSAHQYSAAFTDWSTTGKADGTPFDDTAATTPITVDATYHAAWALTVIYGVYDDAQTDDMNPAAKYLYTGAEIQPSYIIYEQGAGGTVGTVIAGTTGDTLAASDDFAMTYYKTSDTTEAPIQLRNVLTDPETYTPKLAAKTGGDYDGFELVPTSKSVISIVNSNPDAPEGEPNKTTLTPVIDTDKQSWKVGDTVVSPLARVQGLVGEDITTVGADTTVSNAVYDVNYYTFVDANGDGNVDDGELTKTDLATIITNSATDEGKYVIKIELTDDYANNYTLEAADALTSGGTVAVYTGAGFAPGQNMKLEVAKGKPWITDLKVTSDIVGVYPDNTYTEADKIGGKGDSILTGATEPTPDEGSILAEDYGVRGGSTQTEVKINIKLSEDIPEADIADRVVVTGGKADTTPAFTKEEDGSWTITVQLGSNDPTNPDKITITTKESDKTTDGFAYEFEVQTLKALPTIAFKPGNSPFGLIERMSEKWGGSWTEEQVKNAKDAFLASEDDPENPSKDKFGNLAFAEDGAPTYAETGVQYTTAAWRSYNPEAAEDAISFDVNYDLDEDALFVYTAYTFEDPGFKLYDQAGNEIQNPQITKEFIVKALGTAGAPTYSDSETVTDVEITEETRTVMDVDDQSISTSSNCYHFGLNMVRPDTYTIKYTCTYTDLSDPAGPTEKTEVFERPVIVLTERGDVNFSQLPMINTADVSAFRNNWSTFENRNSLYAFRIADVTWSQMPMINTADVSSIRNSWSRGFTAYYNVKDVLNGGIVANE